MRSRTTMTESFKIYSRALAFPSRNLSTSSRVYRRLSPFKRTPIASNEAEDGPEPPRPSKARLVDKLRLRQAELEGEQQEARRREGRNDVWISVYLSVSERKPGCFYSDMTYDVATAQLADNGARVDGRRYRKTPSGSAPTGLRPFRLCFALGGFNSASSAKQFLKALKYPAQSRYLLAPGVEPLATAYNKQGVPLSHGQRRLRGIVPKSGQRFFYENSIEGLAFKMAVVQRVATCHPFNTMPLRLALFSNEAAQSWQEALQGTFTGGPNDPLQLRGDKQPAPERLAAIDLQRRHPLRSDALAYLQPVKQSPALPFTRESGDRPHKAQRRSSDMIRELSRWKPLRIATTTG